MSESAPRPRRKRRRHKRHYGEKIWLTPIAMARKVREQQEMPYAKT
jgi:hypothetical protein